MSLQITIALLKKTSRSTIDYRLSTINSPLSTLHYQLFKLPNRYVSTKP
ncbi:MAG: hypothetical protein ACRC62_02745 [Microcoleus sp.]